MLKAIVLLGAAVAIAFGYAAAAVFSTGEGRTLAALAAATALAATLMPQRTLGRSWTTRS